MDTPALPFCHLRFRGQKPPNPAYPKEIRALGDHLRKRRLDLGLQQKQVAGELGVDEATVYNWEKGRTIPAIRFYPATIRFLGYDPLPGADSVGERLRLHRQRRGLFRKGLARQLGVDEGTLARWERGIRAPKGKFLEILDTVVTIDRA